MNKIVFKKGTGALQSVYLDNAATTQLCAGAKSAMIDALECYGNPSSLYSMGLRSSELIEAARQRIAAYIKARADEVYFTSGGTESDNIALFGAAAALRRRGNRIVTTAIEHSAVLAAVQRLQQLGFETVILEPDSSGSVPLSAFEAAINADTILVSAMLINNETGAFLPVDRLKAIITDVGSPALLHCDATQGFGKYPVFPERAGIDLLSFSAHKIHGPKGVGALYVKKSARIQPLVYGGEQERQLRPGTEPLISIAGFGAAVGEIGECAANEKRVCELRDYLLERLRTLPDIQINSPADGSAYVVNISVLGYRSETLLHHLDALGVCVSSGSACARGKASHVLAAMGLPPARIDSALRISFSRFSTRDDIDRLIQGLSLAQSKLIKSKR